MSTNKKCQRPIAHFKTIALTLKDIVPSFERFHETYKMYCPAALNRLVTPGVPATVEHKAAAGMSLNASAPVVAECTQNFLKAMNLLERNWLLLTKLCSPFSHGPFLFTEQIDDFASLFLGEDKMERLAKLVKMGVGEELTELQARQLQFNLESSYNSFIAAMYNDVIQND